MPSKNLLLIFTRNPELGKCKTRLAAAIGDTPALAIYNFLLEHTATITKNIQATKIVYYSETIWEKDIWDCQIFQKKIQRGTDLGIRMKNAFNEGFEAGFEKIIVMGSDMFDLTPNDLSQAFSELNNADVVIGPATDGGYYLLGMKTLEEEVFNNKQWGTDSVLEDTLNDLKSKKIVLLAAKNDVDVYEDIKNIAAFEPFLKNTIND